VPNTKMCIVGVFSDDIHRLLASRFVVFFQRNGVLKLQRPQQRAFLLIHG
jgi:hypothetical protein